MSGFEYTIHTQSLDSKIDCLTVLMLVHEVRSVMTEDLSGCEYTYSLGTVKLTVCHHLTQVHEVRSVMTEDLSGCEYTYSLGTVKLTV